ncbi:DUF2750 domain-containing protein [Paraglaciecola aquimarina]|uniref:DUF2750 domain-containing protein n=1 Tax=Paraglaciecola aquimarina TaxID=1235557 RepID=A0ABU3SZ12_9ALTE|nr:DUF2750 domain-containing protein [Paraglaciecola aquimarina]MDU0355249.1 DUF2750 domain-containing protein [Paraglaciecola aquimarina]
MSYVSAKDFLDLSKMLPEQRFEYAISNMLKAQYLWGLYGKDGWVMLKADEDTCMPIWPHKEFAEAWVKEDYPDCEPKQIEFVEWLDVWLPGMTKNNTLVLVFPLGDDEEGIILSGAEMLECIEDDLKALED